MFKQFSGLISCCGGYGRGVRRVLVAGIVSIGLAHAVDASASSPRFVGGWERPGTEPWQTIQVETDRPVSDSFRIVHNPVRTGHRAAEFIVRQGYSRYGYNESSDAEWNSGEHEGASYWYAWSTLFPKGWREPYGWGTFIEWHSTLVGVPLRFDARGHSASLFVSGGLVTDGYSQYVRRVPILSTLSNGRWNDFVMHVRWSSRTDGRVDVWHRVHPGSRFRLAASLSHVPTLNRIPGQRIGMYTLWGLYRRSYCPQPTQLPCAGATGYQPPNVIYQDAFSRGASLRAVLRASFGEAKPTLSPTRMPANVRLLRPRGAAVRLGSLPPQIDAGCRVDASGASIHAAVQGGADTSDTAVAQWTIGNTSSAATFVHDEIQLSRSSWMPANVSVLQMLDKRGKLVLELYLEAGTRVVKLWSPPGALRRSPINVSAGFAAPSGAAPPVRVDVMVRPGHKVALAAEGRVRAAITNLHGGTVGAPVTLRVGVDHYDSQVVSDPLEVTHTNFSVTRGGWADR